MEMFTTYCLNEEERVLVLTIIEDAIKDLHSEIIRTESFDYKEMLLQRRNALDRVRQKLSLPEGDAEYA